METVETSNFQSFDQNQPKPNNNMALAIIGTVLGCCFSPCNLPGLILGIIAIVNASKVNSSYDAGNYDEANKAAKNAKTFSYIALGLAVLGLIINLVWFMAAPDSYNEILEEYRRILEEQGG